MSENIPEELLNSVSNLLITLEECKQKYQELEKKVCPVFMDILTDSLDENIKKYLTGRKNSKMSTQNRYYDDNSNNRGKKWLDNEVIILKDMLLLQKKSIPDIAKYLGRSILAIEMKACKENLINYIIENDDVCCTLNENYENINFIPPPNWWNLHKARRLYNLLKNTDTISLDSLSTKYMIPSEYLRDLLENGIY